MMAWVRHLLTRERELRMIWAVENDGRRSYLAGTAHFFPYSFTRSLRRYLSRVETVLFEGPLDQDAAGLVVEYGSRGERGVSLVDALDPDTIGKISRELGSPARSLSSHGMYRGLFAPEPEGVDWDRMKGVRPWMAFFHIWSHYLHKHGWTYNMELEALKIAGELGRRVRFLETIEEQLDALDRVPLERFVRFLAHVDWRRSRREHLACYLQGDLDGLLAKVGGYPTVCEAIIDKRDPILTERMTPFFREGRAIAFVGAAHCRGITALLREDGYRVGPAT